jgi:hypothetical protein
MSVASKKHASILHRPIRARHAVVGQMEEVSVKRLDNCDCKRGKRT